MLSRAWHIRQRRNQCPQPALRPPQTDRSRAGRCCMDISFLLLDETDRRPQRQRGCETEGRSARLRKELGLGILCVEHNMPFVSRLCDRLVVLDLGLAHCQRPARRSARRRQGDVLLSRGGTRCLRSPVSTCVTARSKRCATVSIKVATGGLVAILGANGAGKSTLLRAISGIARAASGTIVVGGEAITGFGPEKIVRLGVAHVPEGRGIFPDTDREGKPDDGRLCAPRPERFGGLQPRDGDVPADRAPRALVRLYAVPAASSRCWRSAAR